MGFWAWVCVCLHVCLCVLCEYLINTVCVSHLCMDVSEAMVCIDVPGTNILLLCSRFTISYL